MFENSRLCIDIKRINEFNKRIMSSSDKSEDDDEKVEICEEKNENDD